MPSYQFDTAGKLKTASQAELQDADNDVAILAYITGDMEDGRPYYAYVAVKPSKYREFYRRSEARETFGLSEYGKVVMAGFERKAPQEVVELMRERYGFDENYEQALKAEVSRQRGEHGEKQEEKRLLDIVAMMKSKKN